jgi:CarboxypepD_reg-like domain
MAKQLQLTIPTPCHEDWDAMTPVQQGKFCSSCQKQVVDFSGMSDRQVAEFFKKPSTGSVCGRFMTDQLDRTLDIPKKRMPWIKYFFQFAVPAFLLSVKSSPAKAQGKIVVKSLSQKTTKGTPAVIRQDKPIIGDTMVMEDVVVTSKAKEPSRTIGLLKIPHNGQLANFLAAKTHCCYKIPEKNEPIDISKVRDLSLSVTSGSRHNILSGKIGGVILVENKPRIISGVVFDQYGEKVAYADIVLKGTRTGGMADANGEFQIKAKTGDVLIVKADTAGKCEVNITNENSLKIYLSLPSDWKPNVVITTAGIVSVETVNKKVKKETLVFSKQKINTAINTFSIFPNPVSSGGNLTIECKQVEEGYYSLQLVNQSGQSVHQQEIWIDAEAKLLSVDMPVVAAGNYFLVLLNKKSGKKFTEKIIVL